MAKILVAEDDKDIRNLLVDILDDVGYEVASARNGVDALEQINNFQPDLLALDLMMPEMDGFELLNKLRDDPSTRELPVVVLSAVPSRKGELRAWRMGVRHYIPKPFSSERVHLSVKVALREADEAQQEAARQNGVVPAATVNDDQISSNAGDDTDGGDAGSSFIRTNQRRLNEILGGGIVPRSFSLIEGDPSSGKSVLSQNFVMEALYGGHGVQYFTSGGSPKRLVKRMHSIGMDVSGHIRERQFAVSELDQPKLGLKSAWEITPEKILSSLTEEMQSTPDDLDMIVLDDLTEQISFAGPDSVVEFIDECRQLCDNGKTIILTTQGHALEAEKRERAQKACDVHMELELIKIGGTKGAQLQLLKSSTVEVTDRSQFAFKVSRKVGMERLSNARTKN
ncbi:MAG: response regulator [SAR202 cluster bacterium]|jgi:archaellum biogenesis ATPase FlaH/ActR/RegA family two-component response regulator|nr:response regulator [SAR202 cluster bacterium]MDP6664361.1 response regulator [SAR202 cluster bacterium]|tara:strand:- start:276 stop:1466 length:1191 start_codon:yes stop_codon:yes gene_type:complete